jgi:hypothetical protein
VEVEPYRGKVRLRALAVEVPGGASTGGGGFGFIPGTPAGLCVSTQPL